MQTEPTTHPAPHLGRIALILRVAGSLSFWLQVAFGAGIAVTLVFALTGRVFNQQIVQTIPGVPVDGTVSGVTPGLGIGVFWAIAGLVVTLFNVYIAFRLSRFGRRLRNRNPDVHPKKADVKQILQLGAIAGAIGLLVTILGAGATLGVLLAKSITQPQFALYNPARAIRSIDIFVALANMNGIAANFIALISTSGLFYWLEHRDHHRIG